MAERTHGLRYGTSAKGSAPACYRCTCYQAEYFVDGLDSETNRVHFCGDCVDVAYRALKGLVAVVQRDRARAK